MKKLICLIVIIALLGLIVAGCFSVCVNLLGVVFFGEKILLVLGRLTPCFIIAYYLYK